MRLLCDENIGTGVPRALSLVGLEASSLYDRGWRTLADTRWLGLAGRAEWLIFSCDKKMLQITEERETIIRESIGIVFLTNGNEYPHDVLRLLLTRWKVLELLDRTEPRPFARFLSPRGRLTSHFKRIRL